MSQQFTNLKAYLCLFVGGFWGLHHIYLRRPDHAFLINATIGGYFLLGLFRDLWKIPVYVREANNDVEYNKSFNEKLDKYKKPQSSVPRRLGILISSNLFSHIFVYAIPNEHFTDTTIKLLQLMFVPLGASFGTWLAGNVGREKSSYPAILTFSYFVSALLYFLNLPISSFVGVASVSAHEYIKKFRLKNKKISLKKSISIFIMLSTIYWSLWGFWFYFNCEIDDAESPIKCRDAVHNFIRSNAFREFTQTLLDLLFEIQIKGWEEVWNKLMSELDLNGRTRALIIFQLPEDATPQQIVSQYRSLARKYHPDRERDPEKKLAMHNKFIEIQEAYKLLEPSINRYKIQQQMQQDQLQNEDIKSNTGRYSGNYDEL